MRGINEDQDSYSRDFLRARREAWIILVAWAACLLWTVGYCARYGYDVPEENLSIVLGMPGWVVWGVLTPWLAATVFTVCFGLLFISDDELDEEPEHKMNRTGGGT